MSGRLLLVVAALAPAAAGCASGNLDPQGFEAGAPSGWTDRTQDAERQRGTDYEVVYEKPGGGDEPVVINVQRSEAWEDVQLQAETERARTRILEEFGGRASPARLVELGGDAALRFDHQAGDVRSTRVLAVRGVWLYVITLQAPAERMGAAIKDFDAFVKSWRWAD